MENEQITFKCERCLITSRGVLGFSYSRKVFEKRKWFLMYEIEMTTRFATCENCLMVNEVWPAMTVDEIWKKKDGKEK